MSSCSVKPQFLSYRLWNKSFAFVIFFLVMMRTYITYTQTIFTPASLNGSSTFNVGSTQARPFGCSRISGCRKKLHIFIKIIRCATGDRYIGNWQPAHGYRTHFCMSTTTKALFFASTRIVRPSTGTSSCPFRNGGGTAAFSCAARCAERVRSTSPVGYSTQNDAAFPYSTGVSTGGRVLMPRMGVSCRGGVA